jgi:hypothetical protein
MIMEVTKTTQRERIGAWVRRLALVGALALTISVGATGPANFAASPDAADHGSQGGPIGAMKAIAIIL